MSLGDYGSLSERDCPFRMRNDRYETSAMGCVLQMAGIQRIDEPELSGDERIFNPRSVDEKNGHSMQT